MRAFGPNQFKSSKILTRLAICVFHACQRLYPRQFRNDFSLEMQSVFEMALNEAGRSGWQTQIAVFLRELVDYPACLLRAYMVGDHRKEAVMSTAEVFVNRDSLLRPSDDGHPGSIKDAFLAAVPLVWAGLLSVESGLFASLLASEAAHMSAGWQTFAQMMEIGSAILFALAMPVMLFLAWRRGWPRWFGTWMPFFLVPLVALINWPLQAMEIYWIGNLLIYLLLPLALVVLVVAVGTHDRLRAQLATLPILLVLWMLTLEFTIAAYRDLVSLVAWLLAGLVAALILRKGSVRQGMWLVIVLILLVGLLYSWARTFHNHIPLEHVMAPPTIVEFISRALTGVLSLSALLVAPLLVWAIRQVGLQSGKRGMMGYYIALAGLFIELTGYLGFLWWFASEDLTYYFYVSGSFSLVSGVLIRCLTYLGMLVYLAGMALLAVAASQRGALPGRFDFILLALLPLALPLMGTAPLLFNFSTNPPTMPYEIGGLRSMPLALVYALGALWILAGCWLAARRRWAAPTGGVAGE
jgi:hypothetical protein